MSGINHLNPFESVNCFFKLLKLSKSSNISWFFQISNNFSNLFSEVLINLFKFKFDLGFFFFILVSKLNTYSDKRNNLIKWLFVKSVRFCEKSWISWNWLRQSPKFCSLQEAMASCNLRNISLEVWKQAQVCQFWVRQFGKLQENS